MIILVAAAKTNAFRSKESIERKLIIYGKIIEQVSHYTY